MGSNSWQPRFRQSSAASCHATGPDGTREDVVRAYIHVTIPRWISYGSHEPRTDEDMTTRTTALRAGSTRSAKHVRSGPLGLDEKVSCEAAVFSVCAIRSCTVDRYRRGHRCSDPNVEVTTRIISPDAPISTPTCCGPRSLAPWSNAAGGVVILAPAFHVHAVANLSQIIRALLRARPAGALLCTKNKDRAARSLQKPVKVFLRSQRTCGQIDNDGRRVDPAHLSKQCGLTFHRAVN